MAQAAIRIAALGDIHFGKADAGTLQPLLKAVTERADVLLLLGDLTNHGTPDEAQLLGREFTALRIPTLAVLGNHDFEAGKEEEVRTQLTTAGLTVLDGDAVEVLGIGFAGVKGFAGGFDQHQLAPWGESIIKQFVHEAVNETLKLESALAKLRTPRRIALLHYSPIRETVAGKPVEIYPFLGCSRLEEAVNRFSVTAVFHGHAHRGTLAGHTHAGVPVYNVAMPLLRKTYPDQPPVYFLSVPSE